MRLERLTPCTSFSLPRHSDGKIGVVGGTGRLGKAFLSRILSTGRYHDKEIHLIGHDDYSNTRLELLADDLNAPNLVVVNIEDIRENYDVVAICSGASTRNIDGANKKSALECRNIHHLNEVLSKIRFKAAVIATNPTTRLLARLQGSYSAPLIGIGVENDNIRYRHASSDEKTVLVGAHNFPELVQAVLIDNDISSHDGSDIDFCEELYFEISDLQDQQLNQSRWSEVLSHKASLKPKFRWWASQRANTIVNGSAFSAAAAMDRVLGLLTVRDTVHTDLPVCLEIALIVKGREVVAGWPFSFESRAPMPAYFTPRNLERIFSIFRKYELSRE